MKRPCGEIRELLEDFLDGNLPAKQELFLREHLRGCSACRLEAETARGVVEALRTLPEVKCSDRTLRMIEEVTVRKEAERKTLETTRFPRGFPLWKGVVLAAAAAACLYFLYPHADKRPSVAPEYTNEQALEARAVARDSLVRVAGVVNRTQRKAVGGFLREDLPKTVRKSIRSSTPFLEGGKV